MKGITIILEKMSQFGDLNTLGHTPDFKHLMKFLKGSI